MPEGTVTETEVKETEVTETDFDKERALATIHAQRASEKALKARLAEAEKKAAAYDSAEAAKAEAEKDLAQKVSERDAAIVALRSEIADRDIKDDFEAQAALRGIDDDAIGLAYLAAKEQGLLGKRDPASGAVGDHGFDVLEEKFPSLFGGEPSRASVTGDAGRRGKGKAVTPADTFNRVVRDAFRR